MGDPIGCPHLQALRLRAPGATSHLRVTVATSRTREPHHMIAADHIRPADSELGAKPIHCGRDISEDVLNRLLSIDVQQYPSTGVEAEERFGLRLEYFEAMRDRRILVVWRACLGPDEPEGV